MGDPWGIGDYRGVEKPNIKQIVNKNRWKKKKLKKAAKSGKKIEKIGYFFLLKMVYNALGTPRNTFKSQKSVKKKTLNRRNREKIEKIGFFWPNLIT